MESSFEGPSLHARLAVDEGGLRLRASDESLYVPFEIIADVEVRPRVLRSPALVLVGHAGARRELVIDDPAAAQRTILEELLDRRNRPGDSFASLGRGGRAFDAWLHEAANGGGYRREATDFERLDACLADPHGNIEERAAAAYLVLEGGGDDDLDRAMMVFLPRLLPPIVLAAARFARGGATLVSDDLMTDAAPFLSEADRTVLEGVLPSSTSSTTRIAQALERTAQWLRDRPAPANPSPEHRLRSTVRLRASGLEPERWIGRSWGF